MNYFIFFQLIIGESYETALHIQIFIYKKRHQTILNMVLKYVIIPKVLKYSILSSLSLTYFFDAVPMRKCLARHDFVTSVRIFSVESTF